MIQLAPSTTRQRWLDWHAANPHVYGLFKQFTFEAIGKGHKRLSAWLVINRIRWETTVETNGGDFKISNNFIAYYARLFMEQHPEHRGFFRTRPLKRGADKEDIGPDGLYAAAATANGKTPARAGDAGSTPVRDVV